MRMRNTNKDGSWMTYLASNHEGVYSLFVFYVLLSLLCVDLCILDCDAGVLDYLFHSSLVYSVIVDVVIFGTFLTLQLV